MASDQLQLPLLWIGDAVDPDVVYEATRMMRLGAAAFVQTVESDGPFYLYGPGFQVQITRTDPEADYPGKTTL